MLKIILTVLVGILVVAVTVCIVMIVRLSRKIAEMNKKQRYLENKLSGDSVETILCKVLKEHEDIAKDLEKDKKAVEEIREKQKNNFDRVGIVRYNASREAGAKLSYSLGLSNEQGDGLVITGLHYNDGVNIYVKKVYDGASDMPLSKEEIAALDRSKLNK